MVPAVPFQDLAGNRDGANSAAMQEQVIAARHRQTQRFQGSLIHCNAQMPVRLIKQFCGLAPEGRNLLAQAMERFGLSARAYHRILKIARTIADLEGAAAIQTHHVAEAIQYRSLDRTFAP